MYGLEPQMTSGNSDRSASPALSSAFPVHPLPARFAPRPQNTPHNPYPTQYVMSWHPPPPQNQPSQPHAYHGYHPLEPYPPTRYFPHLRHQPQPYFQHQFSVQGGDLSYQQAGEAGRLLPPTVQFATGGPGPSYAGSYGGVQQCSPPYRPPVQPSVYQSYYGQRSSADTFIRGNSTHIQQQSYPISYSPPRAQCPRRDPNTLVAQSTGLDPLSSSRAPSNSSTAVTASRHTIDISSATDNPSEQRSIRGSQNVDAHQLRQNSAASTAPAHVHSVRRHYHPNPPPNRSEWVMWVGNIPSDATEDELGRFLTRPALLTSGSEANNAVQDNGVMSIFLISRSKCAFVNYQSKEHLNRAISQFTRRKLRPHDRRCPPLVCRARRKEDDLRAGVGAQRGMGIHARYVKNVLQKGGKSLTVGEETADGQSDPSDLPPSASKDDEIPKSNTVEGANHKVPTQSPSSFASTSSSFLARHFPKRFFILKSLTRYDLDLSTERGVWATQKHNEAILDRAFRTSMEVILIFSVNKSGEFYGYARMASGISRGDRIVSWAPRVDSLPSTSSTSTSRAPTYGPRQQPSPSHPSQTYTSPSPIPFAHSPDETNDRPSAKFLPERRSAPPALDPPPGSGRQGWSQQSQGPDPPSTMQPQSEKLPGVQAVVGSMSGHGTDNLESRLLPVVEETHGESGVEEDQPAQMIMLPSVTWTHGHSEDQERVASWGETFKVDWLCTQRVQFPRTRHLRNLWNHGREIKVSRDGTELEPSVGQQLVDSWSALASEPPSGYDARRAAGSADRRAGKSVPKPGPSTESKRVKQKLMNT
ncbi:YT521-B-like domain-containing protein [Boletus edulis]|nr:YT521-B-like domain-containing protein [Boletus edulis]